MNVNSPPFAPTRALFPFPGLAAQAARASLGGPREILTGTLMAARLATGLRAPHALPGATRRLRAENAKTWLVALTMPAKVRSALQRAFLASAGDNRETLAEAIAQVTDVTAPHLDRQARFDLVRLSEALRRDGAMLAEATDRPVE